MINLNGELIAKGFITTKIAYNLLMMLDIVHTENANWDWIWRVKLPNKILTFVWLALHGRLMTNVLRRNRHMTQSALCKRCCLFGRYVLRKCPKAAAVWGKFPNLMWRNTGQLPLKDWIF